MTSQNGKSQKPSTHCQYIGLHTNHKPETDTEVINGSGPLNLTSRHGHFSNSIGDICMGPYSDTTAGEN